MIYKLLIVFLIQAALINCYEIEKIQSLEIKNINLNDKNRYVIYELDNQSEEGFIYVYFTNGNIMSTKVSVFYYDNIEIDEEEEEILNYIEQKSLYETTYLYFSAKKGKMYFVISNFVRDFSAEMHLLSTHAYTDITKYDIFKYNFKFHEYNSLITFSFDNKIKQKNFLYFQLDNGWPITLEKNSVKTRTFKNALTIKDGIVDISNFKDEIIDVELKITHTGRPFTDYNISIFYSDYKNVFSLNEENNSLTIPTLKKRTYYIFVDIIKAYKDIFLKIKSKDFIGSYYFYETNKMKEVVNVLPTKDGIEIKNLDKEFNLREYKFNKEENYYRGLLIKIETSYDAEYSVSFD